jgi:hypothetical protein
MPRHILTPEERARGGKARAEKLRASRSVSTPAPAPAPKQRHVLTKEDRAKGGKATAAKRRAAKQAQPGSASAPIPPPTGQEPDLERIKCVFDPKDFQQGKGSNKKGKHYIETEYLIVRRDGALIEGKIRYYGESVVGLRNAIIAQNGNLASGEIYAVLYDGSDDFDDDRFERPGVGEYELGDLPDYAYEG